MVDDLGAVARAGLPESAPSNAVARLIALDKGIYALTLLGGPRGSGVAAGFTVPAVHISAPPQHSARIEITDLLCRPAEWIAPGQSPVLVKSPVGGGLALVTAYPGRDPRGGPLQLEIRRLDAAGFGELDGAGDVLEPPFATVFLADPVPLAAEAESVGVEITLQIRGRGDLRFANAPWAGRLGPGLWIEGFMIVPQQRRAAGAIEYKGLTAAGVETAWLASGSPCGSRADNTALVGFAVRQKADPGNRIFDCEYSGYFQSGAVVGPCRNGAPCLSAAANDPLEGMQLRIVERQKSSKAAERNNPPTD